MSGLTLRQVEVIRAVMLTGSISRRRASYLNVSGPGVSRLVKHAEESLADPALRAQGRACSCRRPRPRTVFDQINEVYGKIEGLDTAIANLNAGDSARARLRLGALGGAVHRRPRRRLGPQALPGALHRPQRAQDRGGGRLPPARARRVRGDELRLRAPLARASPSSAPASWSPSCPTGTRWPARRASRCATLARRAADRRQPGRPLRRDHRRAVPRGRVDYRLSIRGALRADRGQPRPARPRRGA